MTGNRKCVHTVGAAFRKVLDVGMFNPVKLADADGKKVDVKQDQKFLIFGFSGTSVACRSPAILRSVIRMFTKVGRCASAPLILGSGIPFPVKNRMNFSGVENSSSISGWGWVSPV